MDIPAENELFKACHILFGPGVNVTRDFLYYMEPSGVKSAFRKMAMLTHPDRFLLLDSYGRENKARMFIETTQAYKNLIAFMRHRDNGGALPTRNARIRKPPRGRRSAKGHHQRYDNGPGCYYSGPIPRRRLLFGQFLYYSMVVSWEALIKAIVWQRRQRPRLGEIARTDGALSEGQIRRIISKRKLGEPIGEAAVRLRYLNRTQLNSMLSHQRCSQRPFGEYFTENKHITKSGLNLLLKDFSRHNSAFKKGSGNEDP